MKRPGLAALVLAAMILAAGLAPTAAALLGSTGYAFTRTVELQVPAVARTETGYVGVMSKLVVTVAYPGSGVVYVSADPLTELDMQAAARMAAIVATTVTGFDYYSFDYFIRVESNTTIVGGPSASGAMAVAIMAALRGHQVRKDFSMTGMVDPDATLGPVGGVPEKLLAAADSGVKVFVIPAGQEKALDLNTGTVVDVVKLGAEKGVKVVPAKTVVDAYVAATGDREILKEIMPSKSRYSYPPWLMDSLKSSALEFKKLALGNITCAKKLLANLPEPIRKTFDNLINQVQNVVAEGDKLYQRGLYYSAASRYFSAAISATRECIVARIILADNPVKVIAENVSRLLDSANRTLNIVEPFLRGLLYRSKNLTDIGVQLAVATMIRINDARETLSEAAALLQKATTGAISLNLDLVNNLAGDAVYSYYRAITAKQWLNLFRAHKGGVPVPVKRLRSSAFSILYFAQSTSSYSAALGVPSTTAAQLIERAKTVLAKANSVLDYIDALVYAIRGYTLATTHMRAAFLVGNESIAAARAGLLLLSGIAMHRGLQPILPSLYLEYGDTLTGAAALQLYIQGASYALLLDTLVPGKKMAPAQMPGTVTHTKTVTITVPKNVTITVTVAGRGGTSTTTTRVPVTVTATGTVTEKTVTTTLTRTVTKTATKTLTSGGGGTASWTALFLTALIAFLAGAAAGRTGRQA